MQIIVCSVQLTYEFEQASRTPCQPCALFVAILVDLRRLSGVIVVRSLGYGVITNLHPMCGNTL